MFCDVEQLEFDGARYTLRCRVCGARFVQRQPRAVRPCTGKGPGVIRKAASLTQAFARWVAAGSPVRTREQRDALFAICQACRHFDGQVCRLCGCPVSRDDSWRNKLRMATESCPATPPKWTAEQPEEDGEGQQHER